MTLLLVICIVELGIKLGEYNTLVDIPVSQVVAPAVLCSAYALVWSLIFRGKSRGKGFISYTLFIYFLIPETKKLIYQQD